MDIFLHNTLTGKKELFTPLTPGHVSMYNCGPTVYNYAHIGNLRSYIFADLLRRMFEWNGLKVNQVVNITDIGHLASDADDGDDKMTNALKREGKQFTMEAMRELANFYFDTFRADLIALNIELPEHFPFASDHIAEDIALVEELTKRDFTYTTSDGVYFDTDKFPEYGALGGVGAIKETTEQSRIGLNSEKKNPRDFALWKFSGKFDSALGYESPFGRGFPGWHIECSAMSVKYLGPEFDIHTGGIDHIPVHHNNEIAQSVCAGYPFARVWMHNAFLNIKNDAGDEVKMAKSGQNFITLQTLRDRGISPLAYRYFLLTARYSSSVDFSWDALEGAQTAWKRLKNEVQKLSSQDNSSQHDHSGEYKNLFSQYIKDDLDTPKALALVHNLLKDKEVNDSEKFNLIISFDKVLGLELDKKEEVVEIPTEVQELIQNRDIARVEKNWKLSDELRTQIEILGYTVKDTENGTEVEKG